MCSSTFDFGSVQGFVTDLCYGVILVLSLLLTVALPYLQRWLRYVSPLLVFVVLGLIFVGVALHATYDYTSLSPARCGAARADSSPAAAPATAESIAAPPLEQVEEGPDFLRSLVLHEARATGRAASRDRRRAAHSGLAGEPAPMTPLLYAAIWAGGASSASGS